MATIYDSYQLANSERVRPFVGSTLNELHSTSEVMQQRYDTSVLGMDAMGEFMKQAKALPQDQALLEERLKHYKGKLEDWSKRADLENVPMDVQRAARSLGNEYKNFSDNYQKAVADDKRIEEMVAKGDVTHKDALETMQGRWKNPIAGMGWYLKTKKAFSALPEDK